MLLDYRCVTYEDVIVPYEEGVQMTPPEEKAKESIKVYREHLHSPESDVTIPGGEIDDWSVYRFGFHNPQKDSLLVTLRLVSETGSFRVYINHMWEKLSDRVDNYMTEGVIVWSLIVGFVLFILFILYLFLF